MSPRPLCPDCEAYAEPAKTQARNGAWHVGYRCFTCDRWVLANGKRFHPQDGWDLDVLPVVRFGERDLCEHCGKRRHCEVHHYAPRALFGNDADQWPTGWLCVGDDGCPELWHRVI